MGKIELIRRQMELATERFEQAKRQGIDYFIGKTKYELEEWNEIYRIVIDATRDTPKGDNDAK